MGTLVQMSIEGMWGNWHKWTFGEMGTLGPMDTGASGHWGQMNNWGEMGTRKDEHQSKWALRSKCSLWDRWTLGQVGIGGNDHQEK